jgi:hypothetical protein
LSICLCACIINDISRKVAADGDGCAKKGLPIVKTFGRGDAIRFLRKVAADGDGCAKKGLPIVKTFGRGDAIRTRNQRFWRPLLYR